MDKKIGFEAIYSTFDNGTIALIKSLLNSNNINYYIDNENASKNKYPVMTVMIAKNQVGLAKKLLKPTIKD